MPSRTAPIRPAPPEQPPRRMRGAAPLSAASRRRLLAALSAAAAGGDAEAAGVLVKLSRDAEERRRVTGMLVGHLTGRADR